jgi:hypothetical protein
VRKIVLERGSSFEREETKYLIFLLPLLEFSLITLSHPTSPTPFNFRKEKNLDLELSPYSFSNS